MSLLPVIQIFPAENKNCCCSRAWSDGVVTTHQVPLQLHALGTRAKWQKKIIEIQQSNSNAVNSQVNHEVCWVNAEGSKSNPAVYFPCYFICKYRVTSLYKHKVLDVTLVTLSHCYTTYK